MNKRRLLVCVCTVALLLIVSPAFAQTLTWDTSTSDSTITEGSGIWQAGNWWDGSADTSWTAGSNAVFGGGTAGTAGTVILAGNVAPSTLTFNGPNAGTYNIDLGSSTLSTANAFNAVVVNGGTSVTIQATSGGNLVTNHTGGAWNFGITGTLNMDAQVTGAGKIFTAGAGNLHLTNNSNSFTGILGKQNGGSLSFTSIANSGVASAAGAGNEVQTGYNSHLLYTGSGDSTNRMLTFFGANNGTLNSSGTGALVWTGAFNNNTTAGGNRNFTLRGGNTDNNEFQGVLADHATNGSTLSVIKQDSGTWVLSGNNTYTGTTSVNGGILKIKHNNALGSNAGSTTVANGAKLQLDGSAGNLTIAENITVGSGIGAIHNLSGDNTISGQVNLSASSDFRRNAGSLTFTGGINSAANQSLSLNGIFIINDTAANLGTGLLTLTSNGNNAASASEINVAGNTWGVTRINFGGYAKLGVNDALPTNTDVEFGWSTTGNSSGTLDLNGFDQTVRSLGITSNSIGLGGDQNVTGGGTLTVNLDSGIKEFQGRITDGATATNLVKTGAGTQILNNLSGTSSSYTGATTVSAGTLSLVSSTENNNISSSPLITVEGGATLDVTGITAAGGFKVLSGQTLAGNGTVTGDTTVNANANIGPGASIGTLTFDNKLVLDGNLLIELDGTGAGSTDLLAVLGTLDITGATVDFSVIGAPLDDETYVFAMHNGLTGEFATVLNLPTNYFVRYNFGGSNIVLTSVPEPTTGMLICVAMGGFMLRRRRK